MSFIQQFFTSRDNNANAETFVGQEGRLWWNPLTNQIYYSDGSTPGGIPLAGGGGGNGTPGGVNGQVQFNQAGTFGGSANLTINSATGALSAVSFVGNGAPLTSITGANVTGTVANATHAGVADSANSVAGGNVTGTVADATHASVADSANSVAGANVTGTVANATTALRAGTVTTAAQPNITSVGTLTSISVSGNVQSGNLRTTGVVSALGGIISNGEIYSTSQLTGGNINGANIVANGYLCATGNVNATGNISGGNLSVTGSVNLAGQISAVGNITGGNILTGANVSATSNITGGNLISNGLITTVSNVVANYFVGNGSALFAIAGANVTGTVANATYATSAGSATTATSATTAGTVTTNAQPNITSVGTLTSITSTGNISTTGNVTGGNLVTLGQVAVGNSTYSTNSSSITGWSYPGISKSVAAEDTVTAGLFFKSDGTSMYLNGQTGDKVYQYNLSSAWNISTATIYGNVSVLAQDTAMNDMFISSNGGNLYLLGVTADTVFQYTVATPWDITTATYASKSFSVAAQETSGSGLYFSPDLANMYVNGTLTDTVYQYTLATPGDVSTASYSGKSYSTAAIEGGSGALTFNSDGTKMFTVGTSSYNIFQYNLSVPWDVSTASYTPGSAYYIGWQETSPNGLYCNFAQNKIWLSGAGSDAVYQYNTANNATVTAEVLGVTGQLNVFGNVNFPQNFTTSGAARVDSTLTVGANTTLGGGLVISAATSNITAVSQTTGVLTLGGTAQTGTITLGQSTATHILNLSTGATSSANTKSVNIAANGVANSTSNVTVFSGVAGNSNFTIGASTGNTTVSYTANTTVAIANTGGSALSVAGNVTGGNIIGTHVGNLTGTTASLSGNVTGGNVLSNGQLSTAGNITGGNITVGGAMTAVGNIAASWVNGAYYTGTWGTDFVSTGNVTGTNLFTAGRVSATGNLLGGNLTTTGAVYSNYNTNTANTGSFMATGGNTKGGTGYLDFLVAQNTSGGATNPYKWMRTTSDGQLQIINSAYTTNIFNLTDSGAFSVPGPISVSGKQAVNGPAFSAYAAAILQNIPNGTQTKVLFQTEEFDTNNNYASSRFTPTVEGYYQLNAEVRLDGASGTGEMMIVLYKNGAEYKRGWNQSGTQIASSFWAMTVSSVAYANGSTDYFEIYVQQGSGGTISVTAVNAPAITWFNGCMLRGA